METKKQVLQVSKWRSRQYFKKADVTQQSVVDYYTYTTKTSEVGSTNNNTTDKTTDMGTVASADHQTECIIAPTTEKPHASALVFADVGDYKPPSRYIDGLFAVEITHFTSPSDFYINVIKDSCGNAFFIEHHQYKTRIKNYFEKRKHREIYNVLHPIKGLPVCVCHEGRYDRGIILTDSSNPLNTVQVQLIDYGTVTEVRLDQIKHLPKKFTEVPVLGRRCGLADIRPIGGAWTTQSNDKFTELVVQESGKLVAIMKGYKDGAMQLFMFTPEFANQFYYSFLGVLVTEGLAEPTYRRDTADRILCGCNLNDIREYIGVDSGEEFIHVYGNTVANTRRLRIRPRLNIWCKPQFSAGLAIEHTSYAGKRRRARDKRCKMKTLQMWDEPPLLLPAVYALAVGRCFCNSSAAAVMEGGRRRGNPGGGCVCSRWQPVRVVHCHSADSIYYATRDYPDRYAQYTDTLDGYYEPQSALRTVEEMCKMTLLGNKAYVIRCDDHWTRAALLRIQGDAYTFHLVDVGTLVEVTDKRDVQELRACDARLPALVRHAHLYDVMPSGGCCLWSDTATEILRFILNSEVFKFYVEQIPLSSSALSTAPRTTPIELYMEESVHSARIGDYKEYYSVTALIVSTGLALPLPAYIKDRHTYHSIDTVKAVTSAEP